MKHESHTLLIVDRNPKIRAFLKREMESDRYRVLLAENAGQALRWIYHHDPIDLIVLDPDLPDTDTCRILASVWGRLPPLPTVLHTFASVYRECTECRPIPEGVVFVEKKGDSIEYLKQVVVDMLGGRKSSTGGARKKHN